MSRTSRTCGTLTKDLTLMLLESWKEKKKEGRAEKVLKEIIAELPRLFRGDKSADSKSSVNHKENKP